jgi:hypothetical protein
MVPLDELLLDDEVLAPLDEVVAPLEVVELDAPLEAVELNAPLEAVAAVPLLLEVDEVAAPELDALELFEAVVAAALELWDPELDTAADVEPEPLLVLAAELVEAAVTDAAVLVEPLPEEPQPKAARLRATVMAAWKAVLRIISISLTEPGRRREGTQRPRGEQLSARW